MSSPPGTRILRHGTTRWRAEQIVRRGPDAEFAEPGDPLGKAGGFSTCPAEGPFLLGSPEQYAAGKAALFPNEGGPAIVEIEVPAEIVESPIDPVIDAVGEIRFEPGAGLERLRAAWPRITK